ncbi:hypothetical protein BJF89_01220 [Corynebacterium sp. CNJ-954]|uniref:hypothetical protein n=1 Tax=Corynebacterium sp. CNJ-954 TaxID=1904962 RepID=UPI000962A9D0|nr:hypothetical protein [Corynebacterium sp. CNJ-954]OLT54883.1 hypothetical protein BJF89_01220 [Corynebacterium sp. CNJ-954]
MPLGYLLQLSGPDCFVGQGIDVSPEPELIAAWGAGGVVEAHGSLCFLAWFDDVGKVLRVVVCCLEASRVRRVVELPCGEAVDVERFGVAGDFDADVDAGVLVF